MNLFLGTLFRLNVFFAQNNAYERGREVGRVVGILFAIAIIFAVYKKFVKDK
jgi:hypothetical protein